MCGKFAVEIAAGQYVGFGLQRQPFRAIFTTMILMLAVR